MEGTEPEITDSGFIKCLEKAPSCPMKKHVRALSMSCFNYYIYFISTVSFNKIFLLGAQQPFYEQVTDECSILDYIVATKNLHKLT